MGKLKDLWNGQYRSIVRYSAVMIAAFLAYILVFSHNSVWRWARAGIELQSQKRQIERYQREIDEMDRQIQSLSTNKDSLEEFARENFSFAAPGDDVYLDQRD